MNLKTASDIVDAEPRQEMNNSILSKISRGSPLSKTLPLIVDSIETDEPEIITAILLAKATDAQVHVGDASKLPPAYVPILEDAVVALMRLDFQSACFDGSAAWSTFHETATLHGIHACEVIPIVCAENCLLGLFVGFSKTPAASVVGYRLAVAKVMALSVIAIELHADKARIKEAEESLHESYSRMSLAIDGSETGIWDRNVVTGEIHYSTRWKALFGYADAEISNRIEDSYSRVHPNDLEFVQATMQAHFEKKSGSYVVEHRIRCGDGSYKWASSRGKVVSRDENGVALRMIGTTTDITSMRELSDKLQQSVDLITCLTNEVPGLVYQYELIPTGEARFSYVSAGVSEIYELTPEQIIANPNLVATLIHPEDLVAYHASIQASAMSLMPWHLVYRVILPKQGMRWRQGDARPRRLPDGTTQWHGFITDVTDRKQVEIELQEFATIDFLTRLPNRRYFMARMENELARIQRDNRTRASVLMCDLDHFKIINDQYGHAVGDLVLKHFASILQDALRKNDTVGRIGGEEFAVVLSGAGLDEAIVFARRVQHQIDQTPLIESGKSIPITVSIGIAAMSGKDKNAGESLSRSDVALYRAKQLGRNRIEIDLK